MGKGYNITMTDWQNRFEAELRRSEHARSTGNEGMARVCARRAAGIIAAEYLRRNGFTHRDLSAYAALRALTAQPGLPPEAAVILEHMLVRITPDHTLPYDADLPADALRLRQALLGE